MERFDPSNPTPERPHGERRTSARAVERRSESRSSRRDRTPASHRVCDALTEGLIYFMVIFTPWAFGTTEEWSIQIMNLTGYALGLLLVVKWLVRWRSGYAPPRWGGSPAASLDAPASALPGTRWTRHLTQALAVLTVFVLGYILVGTLNARAVYLVGTRTFDYFENIKWLPHSYDVGSSWLAFWMYLGLACFFWALRDWLLGMTAGERRSIREAETKSVSEDMPPGDVALRAEEFKLRLAPPSRVRMPARLQRLLWVVCLNGAVLGLEGILQRLSGTDKLLFYLQPRLNATGDAQFGPYAYRSNGAQYLNLVWPVCLGFWLLLREAALGKRRIASRIGEGSHVVLLPAAVIMAACPVISTSRGGAIVAAGSLLMALVVVLWALRRESRGMRGGIIAVFLLIVGISGYLGWAKLSVRLQTITADEWSNRGEIYGNAWKIVREFPLYGTGAGTFGSMYQMYRDDPNQIWAAYVHDDWLETLTTLGWMGAIPIFVMLGMTFLRAFGSGGFALPKEFLALMWIAMSGCLLHAKFDFPFQVYSILFLFLLLCTMQWCASPLRSRKA